MPNKPKRICDYPGCCATSMNNKCEEHRRKGHREQHHTMNRPEYRKMYDKGVWKRLRLRVLYNNPFCVYCLKRGIQRPATDVDHIIDHRGDSELFHSLSNLQGLCHECHAIKTVNETNRKKGVYYG